jgi:hypothetical protein
MEIGANTNVRPLQFTPPESAVTIKIHVIHRLEVRREGRRRRSKVRGFFSRLKKRPPRAYGSLRVCLGRLFRPRGLCCPYLGQAHLERIDRFADEALHSRRLPQTRKQLGHLHIPTMLPLEGLHIELLAPLA